MKKLPVLLLLLLPLASACGGDSNSSGGASSSGTVVDTDVSIVTTDIESLSVGTREVCIERLTQVVDMDYLREHDVRVEDESSAAFAIENAISEVCADIDPDEGVHPAAHEVVHKVEDALG